MTGHRNVGIKCWVLTSVHLQLCLEDDVDLVSSNDCGLNLPEIMSASASLLQMRRRLDEECSCISCSIYVWVHLGGMADMDMNHITTLWGHG